MDSELTHRWQQLISKHQLPSSYLQQAADWLLPLAGWLREQRVDEQEPLLVGVQGAQGTGKTTSSAFLAQALEQSAPTLVLSLDDFYLTREQRAHLAGEVHPLLQTRGVPGTHDLVLLNSVLDDLLAGRHPYLPRFDKAIDDRLPESQWDRAPGPFGYVLLEGWCVGATAQADEDLLLPINGLEAEQDRDLRWRRYVNGRLDGEYQALFARLDRLVSLLAPSMDAVFEWRELQELKLRARGGSEVMSPQQVRRFVEFYERITRQCLAQLPGSAEYLLQLNEDHEFFAGGPRS